jgi:hypothetical protein
MHRRSEASPDAEAYRVQVRGAGKPMSLCRMNPALQSAFGSAWTAPHHKVDSFSFVVWLYDLLWPGSLLHKPGLAQDQAQWDSQHLALMPCVIPSV